jgi:hypothetical protein
MLLSFVAVGFAQNKAQVNLAKKSKDIDLTIKNNLPQPQLNTKAVSEDLNRIAIGTATDFRTVRRGDTRVVSYHPELEVITVTYTLDPGTYGTNATDIGIMYSEDMGHTWSGPIVVVDNGDAFVNDYPSGIFFNPEGNTDPEMAYAIVQNISHVGGDWGYKMWASMRVDGADQSIEVVHNPDNIEDGYWNQFGLSQRGDQVRCLSMLPQGDWGAYTSAELQPIFGDFNGTDFDWDDSELIEMDLLQDAEGTMAWIGGYQGMDGGVDMAWSNDGMIGYMWMVGVTNDFPSGYQPIVYRTEDAGDSWDFVDVDFFTDEMQTLLEPYIIETSSGMMIPHIFETTGAVDINGELQMFVAMGSSSADVITYPDSVGWTYTYPGELFNVVFDQDGINNIIHIDTLMTANVVDADEGNYAGNGWNHRLSIAKNDNEDQFFFTWLDTRTTEPDLKNTAPDLFGWSRNVQNGMSMEESVCFTEGTLYETFYYFTFGAENAVYDALEGNYYTIPYITSVSPAEFASNGAGDPITLSYVTGIEFPMLVNVGIDNPGQAVNFEVSQNQPNPFTGTTTIEVKTQKASKLMVEVSNLIGQTVYTLDAGTINGTYKINLSAENLEAGVYFYTVRVGEESVTKKMIVE